MHKSSLFNFNNNKSIRIFLYGIVIFYLVLLSMFFRVNSSDNMDLVRHFDDMVQARQASSNIYDYVLNNDVSYNILKRYCYLFNFVQYIIANYFENYYIIVWLFIFIDYCCCAYISISWWQDKNQTILKFIFEVIFCLSFLPYIHAVSGLRNATSACLAAVGIFNYLYKNKSFYNFIFWLMLSISVHPMSIVLFPFVIFSKFVNKSYVILFFVFIALLPILTNLTLNLTEDGFIHVLASKFVTHSGEGQYFGRKFPYFGVLSVSLVFLIYNWFVKASSNYTSEKNVIFRFFLLIMGFIICMWYSYLLVDRTAYFLGPLAPIFSEMLLEKRFISTKNDYKRVFAFASILVIGLLLLLIVVMYIYSFSCWFYWRW